MPGRRGTLPDHEDPKLLTTTPPRATGGGDLQRTAVLGLGNLGALASKPRWRASAVLFKLSPTSTASTSEVDTQDVDAFVECVRYLGRTLAASTWRTSRPTASSSSSASRSCSTSRSSTTISTAPRSSPPPADQCSASPTEAAETRMVINGKPGIACAELVKAMGCRPTGRPVRHARRHLPGPRGGHEPVEVGLRGQDRVS